LVIKFVLHVQDVADVAPLVDDPFLQGEQPLLQLPPSSVAVPVVLYVSTLHLQSAQAVLLGEDSVFVGQEPVHENDV